MHISYELRPMDFGGLIPGLQSRNLDVAMAGITITDARKQVVDFSDGYYNADLLIAVKSTDNSIAKFSDLTGKKVGLKQGTAAASFMKSKYKANYIEFPNIDNAYLDLQAGNLDAVVHDSPNVLYYVKTAGNGKVKSTGRRTAFCHSNMALRCRKQQPDAKSEPGSAGPACRWHLRQDLR